jgi:glycerol-3-phosphate dehydrogenase (NAD(P)+)
MGLGQNAAAMLITRGLAETTRLATAMGAHPATLAGLAGLGDLVATCSSPLSRNRTFGTHLGRGLSVEQASAATRQTTEGVKSAEAILALAHAHDVEMPITDVVSALLHEKLTLDETAPALMQRPPSPSADPRRPDRGRTPHFALPFRRLPRHVSVPPAVQIAVTSPWWRG